MYLRFTQRTNADGSIVRYVALAHNRRVDGKVKPDVLMNLGRVDRLDMDGLRRLAASITKHFGGDGAALSDGVEAGLTAGTAPMEVVDSRPIGASWLLDALWSRLEVASAIKSATDGRRFTTNMERVLLALVANRAIEPMSKLSAAEWASEDVIIPGLAAMDDDQAYRAMDLLAEADTAGQRGFRRYGKSKDHRDDLPQIVIGLAVTREGIPVGTGPEQGLFTQLRPTMNVPNSSRPGSSTEIVMPRPNWLLLRWCWPPRVISTRSWQTRAGRW
jgi:hypothetical protein